MQIQTDHRGFVCGMTGSGKTKFVEQYLPLFPRVVFHDRKSTNSHLIQKYHFTPVHDPPTLLAYIQRGKKRILYQPAQGGVREGIEDFDKVCEIIFKTCNIALVVDEAASFVSGQQIPYYYGEIYRLGREYNIGCISLTQRPKDIPQTLLSESEHMFIFKLKLPQDRGRIQDVCGEFIDGLEDSEGNYPSVYDWKIAIGVRTSKPVGKVLSVAETKEKNTLLTVKSALQTMPYYCFLQWNAHALTLHAPIRI